MRGVVFCEGVWQGGCDGRSMNNVWEAGALRIKTKSAESLGHQKCTILFGPYMI